MGLQLNFNLSRQIKIIHWKVCCCQFNFLFMAFAIYFLGTNELKVASVKNKNGQFRQQAKVKWNTSQQEQRK